VTLIAFHDLLVAAALYFILRMPEPRLLILMAGVTVVWSTYMGNERVAALEVDKASIKKRRAYEALVSQRAVERPYITHYLVVVFLLLVAIAVSGLIMKSTLIAWFALSLAASLAIPVYSSWKLVPDLWYTGRGK